jgi:hypothetical protein
VFKFVLVRSVVEMDEIERLHCREPLIYLCLAENDSQQFRLEPSADHRGSLQQRAVLWGKAINASV